MCDVILEQTLEWISSTFYEQPFCQSPFAKKNKTQTISTEKLNKTHWFKKFACKMLLKLTPFHQCTTEEETNEIILPFWQRWKKKKSSRMEEFMMLPFSLSLGFLFVRKKFQMLKRSQKITLSSLSFSVNNNCVWYDDLVIMSTGTVFFWKVISWRVVSTRTRRTKLIPFSVKLQKGGSREGVNQWEGQHW